jgi:hypothetical protein
VTNDTQPPPWYHAVVCAGCGTHPHATDQSPGSVRQPGRGLIDEDLEVRASDDGVEIETDDSLGSEIVLIPWDQAITVARQIIQLARDRGDFT